MNGERRPSIFGPKDSGKKQSPIPVRVATYYSGEGFEGKRPLTGSHCPSLFHFMFRGRKIIQSAEDIGKKPIRQV
jgi:hypothetical protein